MYVIVGQGVEAEEVEEGRFNPSSLLLLWLAFENVTSIHGRPVAPNSRDSV